jgi:hypothetical protein
MPKNIVVDRRTAMLKFGAMSNQLYQSQYSFTWANVMRLLPHLRYYSAPASTKFHLSCTGGLLIHSVQVTDLAITIASERFPLLDAAKVMLAGLLHDIGKCGLLQNGVLTERYILNPEPYPTWPKQQKWWAPYLYEDSKPMFNVRDLSALYAAQWGLPWDVVQAILCHDGLWCDANKDCLKSEPMDPLLLVIMSADWLSCKGLESKGSAIDKREE